MSDSYILDANGEPVPEPDLLKWAAWFEAQTARKVARTELPGGVQVSTVFLGLDHSFSSGGPPILWETMIFGGDHGDFQERYTSRVDALAGHNRAVALAKGEATA